MRWLAALFLVLGAGALLWLSQRPPAVQEPPPAGYLPRASRSLRDVPAPSRPDGGDRARASYPGASTRWLHITRRGQRDLPGLGRRFEGRVWLVGEGELGGAYRVQRIVLEDEEVFLVEEGGEQESRIGIK